MVSALVRMANNMPELFGTGYPRAGLLRRVGRLEQVAGVRLVTLGDGQGRGVRVLEFRTGTGFAFEVLVDRCFDVGRCELAGQPLSWLSGAGVTGPWYYEPDDWGWFRAWGGGMVVTCGLDHTLGPAEDTAAHFNQPHIQPSVRYGLHGRAAACPPGWPGTASGGTATSACCGPRARCSSPRCSASSSCSGGGSRPGSAHRRSPSTTRSRTPGTRRPRTCSCTTATRASRCWTRAPNSSSRAAGPARTTACRSTGTR